MTPMLRLRDRLRRAVEGADHAGIAAALSALQRKRDDLVGHDRAQQVPTLLCYCCACS
jgi:hypothetical protein